PLGRDFLRRALDLGAGGVVAQPWMYRLVNAADAGKRWAWRRPGRNCFCLVTGDGAGRLTPVPGERVTCGPGIPWVVPPPACVHRDDAPHLVRRAPFHWGGVLVKRGLFEKVGGYCS